MKHFSLFVLIIFAFASLSSVSHASAIFLNINTSAQEVAYGHDAGAATIWNIGPAECIANPAKLGYMNDGVSLDSSISHWFEDVEGIDDMTLASSYIAGQWSGLGVLLPFIDSNSRWGKSIDYGRQTQTDEHGHVRTFESWEQGATFAFGVNLFEFIGNMRHDAYILDTAKRYDLSVGYQFTTIISDLAPEGVGVTEQHVSTEGHGYQDGLGFLGRYSPMANSHDSSFEADITAGLYLMNITNGTIKYDGESQSDDTPGGTAYSFAGQVRIPDRQRLLPDLAHNLLAITFTTDFYNDTEDGTSSVGAGVTLLDIFSLRYGHYDGGGGMVGDNWGWGININYRDLVQVKYDWAEIDAGELCDSNIIGELMLRINLMKLL